MLLLLSWQRCWPYKSANPCVVAQNLSLQGVSLGAPFGQRDRRHSLTPTPCVHRSCARTSAMAADAVTPSVCCSTCRPWLQFTS